MHTPLRTQLGAAIALAVAASVLGYGYFQFRGLRTGPIVSIESPENGTDVKNPIVTVAGIVRNVSRLALNGRQIFVTEAGAFREELLLPAGYSILEVAATDTFGRMKRTEIRIAVPPLALP